MQRFIFIYSFLILLGLPIFGWSQTQVSDEILESMDDDVNVGGDIFSNFQENLESSKIYEDERFFRYGRFFSVNLGTGITTFSGNRGVAYKDRHPSFSLAVNYFMDFRNSFTFGLQFSQHSMNVDFPTRKEPGANIGSVEINLLRPYFGYRYYFDTSDLSTPFSYSNPYLTGRLEYWYQTNKFVDLNNEKQSGGKIGFGYGFGFEFPITIKESYIGAEFLFHQVRLFDQSTNDYQAPNAAQTTQYADLSGFAYSLTLSLNQTW